jgi:hypothetical protein
MICFIFNTKNLFSHPRIPTPENDDGLPSSFKGKYFLIQIFPDTLSKQIQPLTTKVNNLHKSHNRRYNKLKKVDNRLIRK